MAEVKKIDYPVRVNLGIGAVAGAIPETNGIKLNTSYQFQPSFLIGQYDKLSLHAVADFKAFDSKPNFQYNIAAGMFAEIGGDYLRVCIGAEGGVGRIGDNNSPWFLLSVFMAFRLAPVTFTIGIDYFPNVDPPQPYVIAALDPIEIFLRIFN